MGVLFLYFDRIRPICFLANFKVQYFEERIERFGNFWMDGSLERSRLLWVPWLTLYGPFIFPILASSLELNGMNGREQSGFWSRSSASDKLWVNSSVKFKDFRTRRLSIPKFWRCTESLFWCRIHPGIKKENNFRWRGISISTANILKSRCPYP